MIIGNVKTYADAIVFLDENVNNTLSVDTLKTLASKMSTKVDNAESALLYSGTIKDVNSWKIAENLGENSSGKIATIGQTQAGKLLNNSKFTEAMTKAAGSPLRYKDIMDGVSAADGTRTTPGLWDVTSGKFIESHKSLPFNIIAPTAGVDGVFTQTEIKKLLDSNVPTIMDKPTQIYKDIYEKGGLLEVQKALKADSYERIAHIDIVKDAQNNITHIGTNKGFWGNTPGVIMSEIPDGTPGKTSMASLLKDIPASHMDDIKAGGKWLLKEAGTVGTIVGLTIAAAEARAAHDMHDDFTATKIMAQWAGDFVAGTVSGISVATWVATSPPIIALAASGPVGAVAAAILVGASGLVGAVAGGEAVKAAIGEIFDIGRDLGYWAADLWDNLAWAFDNPGAVVEEMSNWLKDLLAKIFVAEQTASPLVLDLDGDGIELSATGAAGSVYFDLDNDGFGEATGWVRGGDGLLALDRNGNGVIDNKSELFGDTGTAVNGFENLKTLDSNLDGRITSLDQKFAQLRVWIDANGDGISQASELRTLSSLGITAINTGYTDVNKTNAGHAVLQEGTFMRNGITRQIADVWFTADQANTEYLKDYTLDTRTLFLPTLRGYGTIADLHIAMSMDKTGAGNLMGRVSA